MASRCHSNRTFCLVEFPQEPASRALTLPHNKKYLVDLHGEDQQPRDVRDETPGDARSALALSFDGAMIDPTRGHSFGRDSKSCDILLTDHVSAVSKVHFRLSLDINREHPDRLTLTNFSSVSTSVGNFILRKNQNYTLHAGDIVAVVAGGLALRVHLLKFERCQSLSTLYWEIFQGRLRNHMPSLTSINVGPNDTTEAEPKLRSEDPPARAGVLKLRPANVLATRLSAVNRRSGNGSRRVAGFSPASSHLPPSHARPEGSRSPPGSGQSQNADDASEMRPIRGIRIESSITPVPSIEHDDARLVSPCPSPERQGLSPLIVGCVPNLTIDIESHAQKPAPSGHTHWGGLGQYIHPEYESFEYQENANYTNATSHQPQASIFTQPPEEYVFADSPATTPTQAINLSQLVPTYPASDEYGANTEMCYPTSYPQCFYPQAPDVYQTNARAPRYHHHRLRSEYHARDHNSAGQRATGASSVTDRQGLPPVLFMSPETWAASMTPSSAPGPGFRRR